MVTLGFLKENKSAVVALLMEQGLTAEAADEKYALFSAAVGQLNAFGHSDEVKCHCYWVPGRIEVVGKHTDYAGGRSLLCAISRGFACISVDNDDGVVNVLSEFSGEQHTASLKVGQQKKTALAVSESHRRWPGARSTHVAHARANGCLSRTNGLLSSSDNSILICFTVECFFAFSLLSVLRAPRRHRPPPPPLALPCPRR